VLIRFQHGHSMIGMLANSLGALRHAMRLRVTRAPVGLLADAVRQVRQAFQTGLIFHNLLINLGTQTPVLATRLQQCLAVNCTNLLLFGSDAERTIGTSHASTPRLVRHLAGFGNLVMHRRAPQQRLPACTVGGVRLLANELCRVLGTGTHHLAMQHRIES
jgi:hypothetical protein